MKIITGIITALSLGTIILSVPALATPTPIVETICIWSGNDGTLLKKKCKIFRPQKTLHLHRYLLAPRSGGSVNRQ